MIDQSFLKQIASNPDDRAMWLAYADWLEERGDPRGEAVRLWWRLTESVNVENRHALQSRLQALVHEGIAAVNPTFTNSIGIKFVLIPPGRFRMGSPESEEGRHDDQGQVDVQITRGFWLGKYPVTQQQYHALMGANPSHFSGADRPVECVSWDDAVAFCAKLSASERAAGSISLDREYRLPTEAQWEYACRAGTQTAYYFGVDASLLDEYSWYTDNANDTTHPVGMKKPNSWGLHDMQGNVGEWCRDFYAEELRGGRNPEVNDSETVDRVMRGGCWDYPEQLCTVDFRQHPHPQFRSPYIGFRLAAVRSSQ